MNILIQREGPLGAVLLTTPIARYLRELHGPGATIHLQSGCRSAYLNNKDIDGPRDRYEHYDQVYNLNNVYEENPTKHIIDAFIESTELPITDKSIVFNYTKPAIAFGLDWSKTISIHAAVTSENRTISRSTWLSIIEGLVQDGYTILQLGTGKDHQFPLEGGKVYSLLHKGSINDTVWAINQSACFICSDSALLHFAGATDTPIVPIFTNADPTTRMPYRHGELGWRCLPVISSVECVGCLSKAENPILNQLCPLKEYTNQCVKFINEDAVINYAKGLINVS